MYDILLYCLLTAICGLVLFMSYAHDDLKRKKRLEENPHLKQIAYHES